MAQRGTRIPGQLELPSLGCPACHRRFTGADARFCPFDGEPLVPAASQRVERDPRIGTTIGDRYLVEALLGEGGMGVVYRVRHRALDKCFALKLMRPELSQDRVVAERFVREARAMAALDHPSIVEVCDFGELPSQVPYFVMELLEGRSLAEIIRDDGPLTKERAVHLARQIASALSAAHRAGIIHRDLKPDNVHVSSSNAVKILDFGVAKVIGKSRLTRTGMVFGTPHYMSPEQASGEAVDARTDVYALGVVLYEMLTGRVPFEAESYQEVLTQHRFATPEPPSRFRNALGALDGLEAITLRCLQKSPDDRYASADDLRNALDSLESGALSALAAPAEADDPPEPLPLGPSPKLVAIAIALILLTAASVFALSRIPQSTSAPASPPPALTPSPTPTLTPSPSPSPTPPPTPSPAPALTPSPKSSKPARAPAPSPAPAESANSFGSSEIIDPWAN